MGDAVTWLIPGTAAILIAGATSFVTFEPIPAGPVAACTSVAVMADHRIVVADCEGSR